MSALQQHKLFVFYLKWEGAMDRLSRVFDICKVYPETSMHSSRMRTARSLTISRSIWRGGVRAPLL